MPSQQPIQSDGFSIDDDESVDDEHYKPEYEGDSEGEESRPDNKNGKVVSESQKNKGKVVSGSQKNNGRLYHRAEL